MVTGLEKEKATLAELYAQRDDILRKEGGKPFDVLARNDLFGPGECFLKTSYKIMVDAGEIIPLEKKQVRQG